MDTTAHSTPSPTESALQADKRPQRSREGCFTCRTRKKRCDFTRPICGHCSRLSLDCKFPPQMIVEGKLVTVKQPNRKTKRDDGSDGHADGVDGSLSSAGEGSSSKKRPRKVSSTVKTEATKPRGQNSSDESPSAGPPQAFKGKGREAAPFAGLPPDWPHQHLPPPSANVPIIHQAQFFPQPFHGHPLLPSSQHGSSIASPQSVSGYHHHHPSPAPSHHSHHNDPASTPATHPAFLPTLDPSLLPPNSYVPSGWENFTFDPNLPPHLQPTAQHRFHGPNSAQWLPASALQPLSNGGQLSAFQRPPAPSPFDYANFPTASYIPSPSPSGITQLGPVPATSRRDSLNRNGQHDGGQARSSPAVPPSPFDLPFGSASHSALSYPQPVPASTDVWNAFSPSLFGLDSTSSGTATNGNDNGSGGGATIVPLLDEWSSSPPSGEEASPPAFENWASGAKALAVERAAQVLGVKEENGQKAGELMLRRMARQTLRIAPSVTLQLPELPEHIARQAPVLLDYFVSKLSPIISVLAPNPSALTTLSSFHGGDGSDIATVFLQMALRSETLLIAVLCWAAMHLGADEEPWRAIADLTQLEAEERIEKAFHAWDGGKERKRNGIGIEEELLGGLIALSEIEICRGSTTSWFTPLLLAQQLIQAMGSRTIQNGYHAKWLCQNYAYHELLSSAACAGGPLLSQEEYIATLSGGLNSFIGAAMPVLLIIASISRLASDVTRAGSPALLGGPPDQRADLLASIAAREAALVAELDAARPLFGEGQDASLPAHAHQFAMFDCWLLTARLYLRQVVSRCNGASTGSQVLVSQILAAIRKCTDTPAESSLLFPLFISGVDAVAPRERETIMDHFSVLEASCKIGNIQTAFALLQAVWELNDRGLRWVDWPKLSNDRGWNISFA